MNDGLFMFVSLYVKINLMICSTKWFVGLINIGLTTISGMVILKILNNFKEVIKIKLDIRNIS